MEKSISHTKQLFGFDYTEEDILRREIVVKSAAKWFEKEFGDIGIKPLKHGFITRDK